MTTFFKIFFCIVLLSFSLGLHAQKPLRSNGMIARIGVHHEVFNPSMSRLWTDARGGLTLGVDGIFHHKYLLFQPGLYVNYYNQGHAPFFKALERPMEKLKEGDYWSLRAPVRLGTYLINSDWVRVKVTAGIFVDYAPKGINLTEDGYTDEMRYLTYGWTTGIGLVVHPFYLDLDYGNSFNGFESNRRWSERYVSLTFGIFL